MNTNRYEHHLLIEQNKLCPFKLKTHKKSKGTPLNWHENIEVLAVVEGRGFLIYEAKEYPLAPGDIIVVNSGDMHRVYSQFGITYHYLIIDKKFCEGNGIPIASCRFVEKFKDTKTNQIFEEIIGAFKQVYESNHYLSVATLRKWVLILLIDLCDKHTYMTSDTAVNKNVSKENVKKMIAYINDHYSRRLSLDEIAGHVGFNKFYLTREFKKYTGQTPFTYINILRCKKARSCILEGMTVTEAASESGFDTLSYFSRTYSKLMGQPPSAIKAKK